LKNNPKRNPSNKIFSTTAHVPFGVLLKAMKKNAGLRKLAKIREAYLNPNTYPQDFATCWMCWIDLTGLPLEGWRREPWSEMSPHYKHCPLCSYPFWKGRIWYPFRKLNGYFGNPSSRWGHDSKETINNP